MHIVTDNKPIASARTPRACDFTDRLRQLTHDVRMIELAAETAEKLRNGKPSSWHAENS
jgi:hypothetical protein